MLGLIKAMPLLLLVGGGAYARLFNFVWKQYCVWGARALPDWACKCHG